MGARAQPCPCPSSTPLSYSSFSLAPGSTSQSMHYSWLVLLPRTLAGLGLCDGDVKAQCLSLDMLKDCHTLPWLYLGTGQLLSPRAPWSHTGAIESIRCSRTCSCPAGSCSTSPLWEVAGLLGANPPLLCAKMQNILIHVSLSCFFSFPC